MQHRKSIRRCRRQLGAVAAATALLFGATTPALALTVTWLGGTGSWSQVNWDDGLSSPTSFPTGLATAVIGSGLLPDSIVTLDVPLTGPPPPAPILDGLVIGRAQDRLIVQRLMQVQGTAASIVNNGHLDLTGSGTLVLAGTVTLSGSGITTVQNNAILGDIQGRITSGQLVIAAGHTLEAAGRLGEIGGFANTILQGLDNRGTIVVSPRSGVSPDGLAVEIGQRGFTNNGLMVVPTATFLSVQALSPVGTDNLFNSAGTIQLDEDSRLILKDANMPVNGRINGPAVGSIAGRVEVANGRLQAPHFSGEVFVNATGPNSATIGISGSVINDGRLTFGSAAGLQALRIEGRGGFAGPGVTDLRGAGLQLLGANANAVLDIGAGHTLQMDSQIGSASSTVLGQLLGQVNNRGTIAVDAGAALGIVAQQFDNTGGVIQMGDGAALKLGFNPALAPAFPDFSGGRLIFGTTGTLVVDRVTLHDVLLAGDDIHLRPGGTVNPGVGGFGTLGGMIRLVGTMRVDGPGPISDGDANPFTLAVADGGATLAGPGTTVFADGPRNSVVGGALTIAPGHTLTGGGSFGSFRDGVLLGFVNQGNIIVDAPVNGMRFEGADIFGPPVLNQWRLTVTAGSTLALTDSSFAQDRPGAILVVDGLMVQTQVGVPRAPIFVIADGTLSGCGTIRAASVAIYAAVVQPTAGCPSFPRAALARTTGTFASAAGPLHVDGNLHLDPGSHLTLDLGAAGRDRSVPALDISGVAELAGVLDVRLGDPDTVAVGDTFQLFSFGSFTGSFSDVLVQGYGVSTFFNGNVLSLLVTSAVPEPAPWALLLAGVSARLLRRRGVAPARGQTGTV